MAVCITVSAAATAASPTTNRSEISTKERYDLDLLYAKSVGAAASLPSVLSPADLGEGGLRADTVRLVSKSTTAQYYVALDAANQLCLIAYVPGVDWTAGSSCTDPDSFEEDGLGIRVYAHGTGAAEAYLLPDAASARGVGKAMASSLYRAVAPVSSLVVVDPTTPGRERERVAQSLSGAPVALIDESLAESLDD